MVINGLKSEDENNTVTLVSDSKEGVCEIVSLLGLAMPREVSRHLPHVPGHRKTVPGWARGHHYRGYTKRGQISDLPTRR